MAGDKIVAFFIVVVGVFVVVSSNGQLLSPISDTSQRTPSANSGDGWIDLAAVSALP